METGGGMRPGRRNCRNNIIKDRRAKIQSSGLIRLFAITIAGLDISISHTIKPSAFDRSNEA